MLKRQGDMRGLEMRRLLKRRILQGVGLAGLAVSLCTSCSRLQEQTAAGAAFGRENDLGQCSEESLRRLEACDGATCEIFSPAFASGCAKVAAESPTFCAEVPGALLDATDWMKERCASSRNPRACYKILQPAVARCLKETEQT
jgi:hypothetical protein